MVPENWRDLPFLTVRATAELFGCSPAAVYMQLRSGRLSAVSICGRTLIRSVDVARVLDQAEPWRPNHARVAAAAAAQSRLTWRERNKISAETDKSQRTPIARSKVRRLAARRRDISDPIA